METRYSGFEGWEGVIKEFHGLTYGNPEQLKKALELEPEPDTVFFAEYGGVYYEGDAVVAYRRGDKYYTVTGGHCSCYGLEGQWDPEDYDYETFIASIERRIADAWNETSESPSFAKATWRLIKKRAEEERQNQ